MNSFLSTAMLAVVVAIAAVPSQAASSAGDPLARYRWKARVLVAFAPDPADPKLARQREIYRSMKAAADERDLTLVEAVGTGPDANGLRRLFDPGTGFHAVLIGKDGGSKLSSSEPVGPDQLFPLIDSMPMRQQEMKQQQP